MSAILLKSGVPDFAFNPKFSNASSEVIGLFPSSNVNFVEKVAPKSCVWSISSKSSKVIVTLYTYVVPLGISNSSANSIFDASSLLGTFSLVVFILFHSSSESFSLYSNLYVSDSSKYVLTRLSQLILAYAVSVPVFSISNSFVIVSPKFNVASVFVTISSVSLNTNCIVPAFTINFSFTVSPTEDKKYAYVPSIDISTTANIMIPITITFLLFFI